MASVELEGVTKSFGLIEAVSAVDLQVRDRGLVVFVGPSGCGKSTLLRMIAGLEEITAGTLRINGKDVSDTHPADRGVAMVFQSYALYPHMNVAENMGFGLKMSGVEKKAVAHKVREAAQILQIEDLLERRPRELSGGQRQRVAIGRAIVRNPDVFLFDEPLSNLDAGLRSQMRVELARLHGELDATMIYVTHDQVEAMTLADRIVVLNQGRVEQVGPPLELYERPANLFVAGFLGQPRMNFLTVLPAAAADGRFGCKLPSGEILELPASYRSQASDELTLGIRPDAVRIHPEERPGSFKVEVRLAEHLGNETHLHLSMPNAASLITAVIPGKARFQSGQMAWITFNPEDVHLFAPDGRRIVEDV